MEHYIQLFVDGRQPCETSHCETRLTVATGPTSIWQQLDLYKSMEIPSIILYMCPMDDHQLFPHNPRVQMRQKGFGLCWSSLPMSNSKHSHMEEVT